MMKTFIKIILSLQGNANHDELPLSIRQDGHNKRAR
jgi:hypothetical protein